MAIVFVFETYILFLIWWKNLYFFLQILTKYNVDKFYLLLITVKKSELFLKHTFRRESSQIFKISKHVFFLWTLTIYQTDMLVKMYAANMRLNGGNWGRRRQPLFIYKMSLLWTNYWLCSNLCFLFNLKDKWRAFC